MEKKHLYQYVYDWENEAGGKKSFECLVRVGKRYVSTSPFNKSLRISVLKGTSQSLQYFTL